MNIHKMTIKELTTIGIYKEDRTIFHSIMKHGERARDKFAELMEQYKVDEDIKGIAVQVDKQPDVDDTQYELKPVEMITLEKKEEMTNES